MNLVINGIDFNKRCDDAKRQLHDNIDWHAQCLGIATYFNVKLIEEKPNHSFIEKMKELRDYQMETVMPLETEEERQARIDAYTSHIQKYIERYLALQPASIKLELFRISRFKEAASDL